MKNAPLRHALEYAFYLPCKALLRALPHGASRGLGRALGGVAFRLDGRHRRQALANLEHAFPALSPAERQAIARRCFRHFGAVACDALSALRFDRVALCRRPTLTNWDELARAESRGHGLLLMAAHLGDWEIAAAAIGAFHAPFTSLGRAPDNPHFHREVDALRTRFGNASLDKHGSVRAMFRLLAGGGRLGMLIDQRVRAEEAMAVEFFGRPCWTSPLLARLSQRFGAPVVPIFGYPRPHGGYEIVARTAIEPAGDGEAETRALTRRYLAAIEDEIRPQPELWLWMHDRWKA